MGLECGFVDSSQVNGYNLNWSSSGYMDYNTWTDIAIRPVVTLKSNVIDINTDYEVGGHWNLK